MDDSSLAHSRYTCTYHLVIIPKYRRKVMYGEVRKSVGSILRKLCEMYGVTLIEGTVSADHVHMYMSIPPKFAISQVVAYLKGKSALMLFDKYPKFRGKGDRHFWARGYYIATVGDVNEETIREYIKRQMENDKMEDGFR